MNLQAAAGEIGGTIERWDWLPLAELHDLPPKAIKYLSQTDPGGYSVPYQQDDALHMLWLESRQEPRPLPFEEVAEKVQADYLKRFEEDLFNEIAQRRLERAGFRFDEHAVETLTAP